MNKSKKNKPKMGKVSAPRGVISINQRGVGFFSIDPKENDIRIERDDLNTALHGDEVSIRTIGKNKDRQRLGKVTKVINRAKTRFVGTLEKQGGKLIFNPDDKRFYPSLTLSKEDTKKLNLNTKILVHMNNWTSTKVDPTGKLLRVIGKKGENEAEIESIILEKGFEKNYPEAVEREAHEIKEKSKEEIEKELEKRKDMRGIEAFTIDPVDAKDFDDAISFRELDNNEVEVGVHIADVSHYVQPGTALDKEARHRSFSLYLVDRTIPMLPEILSNDLCSLNPNEDKLSFSAVFNIKKEGTSWRVTNSWFGKTIIHSNTRFTYQEVQDTLDSGSGKLYDELNTVNEIAKYFARERAASGAIDFDTEEIKFILDEEGKPMKVIQKERLDSHKLVEEMMLLANRKVAEFVSDYSKKHRAMKIPLVYRIHDKPNKEKVADLNIYLKALGYELTKSKDSIPTGKEIQSLFRQIEGKPEEALIKTATIRSMAKAIYSIENIGHFGLAFKHYVHFTSPIRRYPDLLVHRVLDGVLSHHADKFKYVKYKNDAEHASEIEKDVQGAERDSIKLKQVEYMSERIGKIYKAVVSGVAEWGIFVQEEETKAEGLIRMKDLGDDYFELDKKTYSIVGQKTRDRYSLGDEVKVKLEDANLDEKTIDFSLVR